MRYHLKCAGWLAITDFYAFYTNFASCCIAKSEGKGEKRADRDSKKRQITFGRQTGQKESRDHHLRTSRGKQKRLFFARRSRSCVGLSEQNKIAYATGIKRIAHAQISMQ